MTVPVPPPNTPEVPAYPELGSPNFNLEAYTYGSAMPGVSQGLGALAVNAAQNAQISHDNSVTAVQASQVAQDARDAAQGAANFKGLWSALTGPLSKPATVKHNNRIWLLLNNLSDVTASEPGVSADWTSGDTGSIVQLISANTSIVPGPLYAVTTVGVTLTLPATLQAGDEIHIRNISSGQININWAGHTVKNRNPQSPMNVPRLRGVSLVYTGGTLT